MSAPMMSWWAIKSCQLVQCTVFSNLQNSIRCQVQLQLTRGGRRSCAPRPWWPKRKIKSFQDKTNLTIDNQKFLAEVIEDRYSPAKRPSPLREEPYERQEWTRGTMRTGVLAIKIGVVPQWTKDGQRFTTTMLQVLDNHVINYIPPEEFTNYVTYSKKWAPNRYGSVVVGALSSDPLLFTKDYNNLFAKAGLPPKRKLAKFLVTPNAAIEPGTPLTAAHFRVGDYLDCQAKTIGHGFQGVVKRWGFKGGPASHGTTKWHRRPGSIGGGGDKSAVWKGKKMPGHMGMEMRTLQGLQVWRINHKYNVLYVKGQNIPGPTHCYVRIMDSCLHHRRAGRLENPPPLPTSFPEDLDGDRVEETYHEDMYHFSEPTITFQEDAKKK